jgi:predicted dehydrogenase
MMATTYNNDKVNPVGIAVIGAGNWGQNLVRNYASLPGSQLLYVADVSEKVRSKMANLYPKAQVTDNPERIFTDPAVNAVVIAVESPLHYTMIKNALEYGKHVYVEKPLALSVADAQNVVSLARDKNLKLMIGHLLEYHPAVNYIKELMKKGTVGTPLYLYFHRLNLGIVRKDENVWWSLAPHDISVACYLFEAEPVSISANGQSYLQKGIEDVVFATLKFADGRMAHIHVSWLDPHKIRKVTLVASDKMVVFDDMEASEKVRIYDKGAEIKTVNSYVDAITLRTGDVLIPKIPSQEPLFLECQHFLDAIIKDQPVRSDGVDGLRVVKVLEAGSKSLAASGKTIEL